MRTIFGAVAILILGCSSPPIRYWSTPTYADVVDSRLQSRPDDADLLFLRHEERRLDLCDKLAVLRPTPVVLASVVSKHISDGVDEEEETRFSDLVRRWISCDPDNALPHLIAGMQRIYAGDLRGGAESLVIASKKPRFQTYALEWGQETWAILEKEGLTALENLIEVSFRACMGHFSLHSCGFSAMDILGDVSLECHLRRDMAGAIRFAEAQFRLARSMRTASFGMTDRHFSDCEIEDSAVQLCELHLQLGDQALAEQYAGQARSARLDQELFMTALKSDVRRDPVWQLWEEAKGPKDPGTSEWDRLVLSEEQLDRFWESLHRNESRVRPHLEMQVRRGYLPMLLEGLTDEERMSVNALTFPIDRFWKERDCFYPKNYGAESRAALVQYVGAPDSESDFELAGFLQERAWRALIHHQDAEAAQVLKANESFGATLVRAALGVGTEQDAEGLAKLIEVDLASQKAACWALTKLKGVKVVPKLVRAFFYDASPSRIDSRYLEAVPAYFALVDLTGQDFGFDPDKWEAWAKRTGNWEE